MPTIAVSPRMSLNSAIRKSQLGIVLNSSFMKGRRAAGASRKSSGRCKFLFYKVMVLYSRPAEVVHEFTFGDVAEDDGSHAVGHRAAF